MLGARRSLLVPTGRLRTCPSHSWGVDMWNVDSYDDKAYLFTGKEDLDSFDLRTETWKFTGTTMLTAAIGSKNLNSMRPHTLLYNLKIKTQQVVGYNFYIFGGTHQICILRT